VGLIRDPSHVILWTFQFRNESMKAQIPVRCPTEFIVRSKTVR